MLVVSTASAYKFANDVLYSLRGSKTDSDLEAPAALEAFTSVKMPAPLFAILNKDVIHTEVIESSDMKTNTFNFAKN
jgi:threonine synthase